VKRRRIEQRSGREQRGQHQEEKEKGQSKRTKRIGPRPCGFFRNPLRSMARTEGRVSERGLTSMQVGKQNQY